MGLLRGRTGAAVERAVCGCCERDLPRTAVHELGATPGVFICRRCAAWTLTRIGLRR
jgi:hypothetical protein